MHSWNTKQILVTVFCYSWPQLWSLHKSKSHRPRIKKMPLSAQEISPVAISNPLYIQMGICIPGFSGKWSRTQCKLTSLWSVSYNSFLCLCKTELEPLGQDLFCEDCDIHIKCEAWMSGKGNVQERIFSYMWLRICHHFILTSHYNIGKWSLMSF